MLHCRESTFAINMRCSTKQNDLYFTGEESAPERGSVTYPNSIANKWQRLECKQSGSMFLTIGSIYSSHSGPSVFIGPVPFTPSSGNRTFILLGHLCFPTPTISPPIPGEGQDQGWASHGTPPAPGLCDWSRVEETQVLSQSGAFTKFLLNGVGQDDPFLLY